MTTERARELLESTHQFPCTFTIKVIGVAAEDFVGRVVRAAEQTLPRSGAVQNTVRSTPDGAHSSVTLEIAAESPDEVMQLYQSLQVVAGLKFLL